MILNIEKVELGISAGLQDRVIQTYGGVVHMDFSPEAHVAPAAGLEPVSPYHPLDPALLPDLYLAYDLHAGTLGSTCLAFPAGCNAFLTILRTYCARAA